MEPFRLSRDLGEIMSRPVEGIQIIGDDPGSFVIQSQCVGHPARHLDATFRSRARVRDRSDDDTLRLVAAHDTQHDHDRAPLCPLFPALGVFRAPKVRVADDQARNWNGKYHNNHPHLAITHTLLTLNIETLKKS